VYLIDEVHMLSKHSFNALLKTLEEPPEHVKFLFATTDPQKLPVTVLSRCLQFNLRAMRPEQIENQLVSILGKEEIEYDQVALSALAKAADGSMRDGLSLLDQAIAQGAGAVRQADVASMLGTIKAAHSKAMLTALAQQNADQIMQVIADMADNAIDYSTAMDDLLVQLYHVALAQVAPGSLANKDVDQEFISGLAEELSPETIQLYYQIGLISKRDIALAPSLRVGFEMALLRMLAFEPVDENAAGDRGETPINRVRDSAAANPGGPESRTDSADKPAVTPLATMPDSSVRPSAEPADAQPVVDAGAAVTAATEDKSSVRHNRSEMTPDTIAEPRQKQSQPSSIAVTLAGNNEWGELVEQTGLVGLSKELAMHCACEKLTADKVLLALSPKAQHLFKPDRLNDIQAQIQLATDSQAIVEIEIEKSDKETPAECLQRLGYEQLEQTKQNLHNDSGVKALMSEFGATINEQSIKPV
ncbi:MAG: DNA polymerase III subunit gamma/tau, partial [Gammaproteobacteria bacterium]|nr:DNA polymerase III subunit gamma/tau [Gammaproteobacteria bacterium]